MRTLSFLIWTFCSMGLGVWAATVEIGGRTPVEHGRRMLVGLGVSLPELPGAGGRAAAAAQTARITERHTPADRDAVNKLIARRGEK